MKNASAFPSELGLFLFFFLAGLSGFSGGNYFVGL
jgi:hypothetical protein